MQLLKLTRRLRAEHSRRIGSRWSLIRYLAGIRSQGGSRILIHYPASNPDGGKLEGGISSVVRATSDERRATKRACSCFSGRREGRQRKTRFIALQSLYTTISPDNSHFVYSRPHSLKILSPPECPYTTREIREERDHGIEACRGKAMAGLLTAVGVDVRARREQAAVALDVRSIAGVGREGGNDVGSRSSLVPVVIRVLRLDEGLAGPRKHAGTNVRRSRDWPTVVIEEPFVVERCEGITRELWRKKESARVFPSRRSAVLTS